MINYKDSLFVFSSKVITIIIIIIIVIIIIIIIIIIIVIIIIIIIIIIITRLEEVRWGGGPNGTHISMKHHQSLIRTID